MKNVIAIVAAVVLFLTTTNVAALKNGLGLTPPIGWSTWGTGGPVWMDNCTSSEIRSMVLAMEANGLRNLGYSHIDLDDCWEATYRTPTGQITWDTNRFPEGMPALIDFVHAHNFTILLYISAGNVTCSSGGRPHSVPGSEHHYQEDVNTIASWGADGIKADWCGFHHAPLDGIAVGAKYYKEISAAVMNTSKPMFLQGVAAVMFLLGETPNYVNSWRATMDHHDDLRNMIEIFAIRMSNLEPVGRPGAWPTNDVLMTGGAGCANHTTAHCPGMTSLQYMTEWTMWNVMQSPLIVCTDLRVQTPVMKRLLYNKLFLSINQDTRTPPGKYIGGDHKNCKIIGRELCSYWLRVLADGSVFLVLFNANEFESLIEFDFGSNLKHLPSGFTANATVQVTDMFGPGFSEVPEHVLTAEDKMAPEMTMMPAKLFVSQGGTVTGMFSAKVQPYGVASVLLKPIS